MTLEEEEKDPIDRAIDEALASMVQGEPRRVSGASVRRAAGESRGSRLPMWFAAAAVLILASVLALRARGPVAPASILVARSTEPPAPVEARATPFADSIRAAGVAAATLASSPPGIADVRPAGKGHRDHATTGTPYEGLPRLTIALIDLPEPLSPTLLDAGPIQIPRIDIAPLSIPGLFP